MTKPLQSHLTGEIEQYRATFPLEPNSLKVIGIIP